MAPRRAPPGPFGEMPALLTRAWSRPPSAAGALHFGDGADRVLGVGEIDLEVVLRAHLPGAVLREGMTRAGDDAPARGGEPLHRGMADAAARPGKQHDASGGVVRGWHGFLLDRGGPYRGDRRMAQWGRGVLLTAIFRVEPRPCASPRRPGGTRPGRGAGTAGPARIPSKPARCENPSNSGGRGTSPIAYLAVLTATAFSRAKRLSSGRDCWLAQAPMRLSRGRL